MRTVAYYRVSTVRQGQSGLGLDAQRTAVLGHLAGVSPLAEFTEIETGSRKGNDRPQLAAAMAACRLHRATLIIAKLDQLARNVAFVSALMESGVEFVAVDFPQANRLTIHILAAVAEHEREMISARTRAALAQSKKKLGGWRGGPKPGPRQLAAARKARQSKASARVEELRATVIQIGAPGPAELARKLNGRGIQATRGGPWSTTQASRLLDRLAPARRTRSRRPIAS